uniref:Phage integrase n=1 Tax=Ralstonia solanacearum TaxID=305 RepID=A0A0S4TXK9_RALSL
MLAQRAMEAERRTLQTRTPTQAAERLADSSQGAAQPRAAKPRSTPPARTGVRLTAVVEAWAKERQPEPQTVQIADRVVKRFYEHVGFVPVRDMTRAHVLQFKDRLLASGQTATNTNKQLTMLRALLSFAVDNQMADINAAQGVKVAERKNAKATRMPFDLPALQAIFSSPVYTKEARPDGGAGEAAYWLPLLAMFTGARVEELCQLRPEDIYEDTYRDAEDNERRCWVMRITNEGEGQGVKNAGSVRRIPIHAELLARGFVEYAQSHKGKPRIFPALKPNGRGAESGNWSKWFGKYLRNVIKVKDERMVFHSFRHLFKDLAREAGIAEDVSDAITGHASGKVSRRYGGLTYPLAPLVAGMERIRVVGLTLPQPPNQSR